MPWHQLALQRFICKRTADRIAQSNGFVLISAIWMLVLAGAIAAILMSRSVVSSRATTATATKLKEDLALRGVIELVVADAILKGPRSLWWTLPADGRVQVNGVEIAVRATSEQTRVDLNSADAVAIDDALRAEGWTSTDRAALMEELVRRRGASDPVRSFDELQQLRGASSSTRCLAGAATLYSGLARPVDQAGATFSAETAVRIEAKTNSGRALSAIIRPGVASRPYDVMEWKMRPFCAPVV